MNRRQRKAKLKRRQSHQEQLQGLTKTIEYDGGTTVTLPRGRREREGFRRQRKENKNPFAALHQFLDDSGLELPSSEMGELHKMARQIGEDAVIRKIKQERLNFVREQAIAARSAEAAVEEISAPTEEEWAEIVATAKVKKKGVAKFAERAGFKKLSSNLEPGVRENWGRA